ncbi:MAG: radical SAM protein [bacterium]|nr:radical SAM protein [bacterium]
MRNDNGSSRFTFGIGLTDKCNTNCPHCYSRAGNQQNDLDYDQIIGLVNALPVHSLNFGTGESILYPRFFELIRELSDRKIKMALTTNGFTVQELSESDLYRFHDIDFSLDFPEKATNDPWRGTGSFECVMDGIARCRQLGIEASLVSCLMQHNSAVMGKLAELACKLGINLRVNIYKPVNSNQYKPTYNQFWAAIADMASTAHITACSEPIINAAIGHLANQPGAPCGQNSFRIHSDGKVMGCVYLKQSSVTIDQLIDDFLTSRETIVESLNLALPAVCKDCDYLKACAGGCTARRLLGKPDEPDEYCFVVRGDQPKISAKWDKSHNLVHENYLCTMIFSA